MPLPGSLEQLIAPLRSAPDRSAVLLDVDGTLAPIVERAEDASVPEATRGLLIDLTRRYGLVACVSGRRAQDARAIVGIGSIAYIGNHGAEMLAPGGSALKSLDRGAGEARSSASAFVNDGFAQRLRAMRVRTEDKGQILALHWRGTPDEQLAHELLVEIGEQAQASGWSLHWGRKVLEIRPLVQFDKGRALLALLGWSSDGQNAAADAAPSQHSEAWPRAKAISGAIYIGDDRTDLDAFRALRSLAEDGRLECALCVAVDSPEAPEELLEQADAVLADSTEVPLLLAALRGPE